MKSYKILFLMMLSLAGLTSCGNDDDDDNSSSERQEEKNLFSRWTRTDGFVLDLSQGRLNSPFSFTVFYQNGATCNCSLRLTGTQSSGEANLSSCFYSGGGSGDPGCGQLNNGGVPATYTKDENSLRVCDPQCADYR